MEESFITLRHVEIQFWIAGCLRRKMNLGETELAQKSYFSYVIRGAKGSSAPSPVELDFVKLIEEEIREAGSHPDADDVVSGKIGFHDLAIP
jgi:hypothetical protein